MSKFEINRKLIHLIGIVIPIIYYFNTKPTILIILLILNLVGLSLDIARHYENKIQALTNKIFRPIMRKHELSGTKKLSGSSYMLLGFLLTAVFFNKFLVITSWVILIASDSFAALIGRAYGTKKYCGKSIIGSSTFVISSILICLCANYFWCILSFKAVMLGCIAATTIEFYSRILNIDDNLFIPLFFCFFASMT